MTTINQRIAEARQRLLNAGIDHDEAALDARLLAQAVLGWNHTQLLTSGDRAEPAPFAVQFAELTARRAHREPLAYITGTRDFWNLTFEVSPDVLIPRPETEGLVEACSQLFREHALALRIADVCTGSGCVAVAIALELPRAQVVATDIAAKALEVAARNVTRHHVANRVELARGDLLATLTGSFEAILVNPPYVPERERRHLQPEVRDFEPATALFAGADGLDIIRRLITDAPHYLAENGYLLFEFGSGQESAIRELISASGSLKMIAVKHDLQGIPRIAITRHVAPGT